MSSLLIGSAVSAQEIRLYGGYNGSNVRESGDERWVGRAGYQFGADVLIGHQWFLKPGVQFLVRNIDYSFAGSMPDGVVTPAQDFTYTSRSLRVPVMLGFRLMDPDNDPALNIYAMGGPSALMNLKADLDNDALTAETNNTQWYIGFGAGLELGFLFEEGGYDIAMSNVFKGSDFRTNPKVNFVYANAGVRLRLAE
jgi:hypothetical protein